MAIQKMIFLKIAGSVEDLHEVLQKLILTGKIYFDFEHSDIYDNSYIIHEYESVMIGPPEYAPEDIDALEVQCNQAEAEIESLSAGLGIKPEVDVGSFYSGKDGLRTALDDLQDLSQRLLSKIKGITQKQATVFQYEQLKNKLSYITPKDLDFRQLETLNYFNYEIGSLSKEGRFRLRQNYENISSIVLNIGKIKDPEEDIQIIIFPRPFQEETSKLLKSLNWTQLFIPKDLDGSVVQMIDQAQKKIRLLSEEVDELYKELHVNMEETRLLINRIYTTVKLEKKTLNLEREIELGGSTFVLNAWVPREDKAEVDKALAPILEKLIIEEKNANEMERQVMPPTQFRNNKFTKPFEVIVRLYGLPSYNELDPTPFFSVTFCLMFGMMFGDIGQGLVYLLIGLFLYKKSVAAGQILSRLGVSSMIFGVVYGGFFGLEQTELDWLPSLIGRPLDPTNIPGILVAGILFGVVTLTISYVFGIFNAFRRGQAQEGIWSKNGMAGYAFYLSLILSLAAVSGIVKIPLSAPLTVLVISLMLMIFKGPLSNLIANKRPLIVGTTGSYFTESIFETIETILSSLSNAISFVRVGAFALNHAGLFLAFLTMSEMTSNIVLKIIILILGNVLILTLEGLVVFIQGLRLEYYEMFSKYFQGGGIAFETVKIVD